MTREQKMRRALRSAAFILVLLHRKFEKGSIPAEAIEDVLSEIENALRKKGVKR